MGRPPCTRTRACSTQSSSTRRAAPAISALRASAPDAQGGRRSARASPGAPSRSSARISTSANTSSKSLSPVMLSSGCTVMPARSIGSRSAVGPAGPLASTITSVATWASGTKSWRPLKRPGSSWAEPSRSASVQMRSPWRGRRASRARAGPRPGRAAMVATTALAMNGLGKHARPSSSTSASASADAAAAAPEVRRDQEPGPAERRDLLPEIGREAPGVERQLLHPLGRAALQEEGARRLLEELLGGREGQVHGRRLA